MHVAVAVLGGVMVASSLLVKLVGLPRQIAANRKERAVPVGLRWFICLGLVSYSTQTVWYLVQSDGLAALAQGPGVVTTGVLLWQVVAYR